MAETEILNIFLHDTEIGTIAHLPGDRHLFTFNQDYMDNENRPILSLSFKNMYGELIANTKSTQTRLPPFFSNLLPEGMLREYLAKQAGIKLQREFYLLWTLGSDLSGAVKALPVSKQALPVDAIDYAEKDEDRIGSDTLFHFSLAGVQLKFSAIRENSKGLTIPVDGVGGSWIVKLPDARYDHVPENEFAMMELARSVGIDVPETMLVSLKEIKGLPNEFQQPGKKAFAIKRFDRADNAKAIHVEDFAQVFNVYSDKKYGHASYRNIAEIIRNEIGEAGISEFIRRLVFNILIGNGDMHLKNWSLIYPDKHTPALAPAYDIVSTIPYIKNDTLALNLADTKIFSEITSNTFVKFAAKALLPEKLVLDTVTETFDRFTQQWPEVLQFGLSKQVKNVIDHHLKTLSL